MSLGIISLDHAAQNEVRRLIKLIPDTELSTIAATHTAFKLGGFRTSKPNAIRTRLEQIALGPSEIDDSLRETLARRSRARTLLAPLSRKTLHSHGRQLAAILTKPVFIVALLLDDREDVRKLATRYISPNTELPTPEKALPHLQELFTDLTELLGAAPSEKTAVTREAWSQQREKLELRIRDLQQNNRRLKAVDDRCSQLQHKLEQTSAKLDTTSAKLKDSETLTRNLTRQLTELRTELDREISRRDLRVAAEVDLALMQEFHGWIGTNRAAEQLVQTTTPTTRNLLERCAAALHHQAEIDRHSGNLATLIAQRKELQNSLEQVNLTLQQALRPTAELKQIAADLQSAIAEINQTINPNPSPTQLEAALINRIHTAQDQELPLLRTLPDQIKPLNLLDKPALERVRNAFHKRLDALQALGVNPDPETEARRDSTSKLGRALAGQEEVILLLDGHNVLFGLPTRYSPQRGESLNEAAKRQRLLDDVVRITKPSPAMRAWVVFDGPTRTDSQAAPNVRVTYSGGIGEHRADNVLLDIIRYFNHYHPKTTLLLVSNDNDLCGSARRLGAQTIPVLELGAFF